MTEVVLDPVISIEGGDWQSEAALQALVAKALNAASDELGLGVGNPSESVCYSQIMPQSKS